MLLLKPELFNRRMLVALISIGTSLDPGQAELSTLAPITALDTLLTDKVLIEDL